MKTQQTQGEWVSKQTHQNYEEFFIMIKHDHGLSRLDNKSGAFSEANARLIAAAPELLEALLACECELSQNHGLAWSNRNAFLDAVNTARAAIKKARGES